MLCNFFLLEKCEDGYWGFSCENSCPCGRNDKGEVIKCDKSLGLCGKI